MFDYNIKERVDLFVEVGSVQAACLPANAVMSCIIHSMLLSKEALLAGC